ncbi:hypothetical protein BGX38DRAFT_1144420 [Terfezia claveryi]|nr:hypothetical protein BGX38DRAFT_1144420 [Terfezia claveryi]
MHLISYFADQIAKYGSLPQYSTEICEVSHKPLKDAYRRTNHINAMPQIIHAYTRAHSFAMRKRNIEQWICDNPNMPDEIHTIITPPCRSLHLPSDVVPKLMRTKLEGRLPVKARYLARYPYRQSSDTETDVARLMDAPLEAFIILQVAVPTFNGDGYMIHHVCCTGVSGGLDGRVPARLNALFKLRDIAAKDTYRLAYVSLMRIVGSSTPDGPEGMVHIGLPSTDHVIRIADIEGMAHLIPIHDEELYIVNNRIDLHTWNDIHDRN